MAAEGDVKDFEEHRRGYLGFTKLMKWGLIVALVTAFIVVLLIYR
jgi:hypothetical protein